MEALYRKYRPTTFKDVVGQEHIERTLKNAIEQGKVSHAYLFCGPRGTGKTTMARILAKALLCEQGPTVEPDGTCPECEAIAQGTHPDVYELDAASRTGVDNVREEIIARVNYAPTRGAWKVYIIDEVHMLTNAAFNALLKTLEEPPAHVIFILATTDPQKVPATILSRVQRFDFRRITTETIAQTLMGYLKEEGQQATPEAVRYVAHLGDGSMRDSLSILDQCLAFFSGEEVTLEKVLDIMGAVDQTIFFEMTDALAKRDAKQAMLLVEQMMQDGRDVKQFVTELLQHLRNLLMAATLPDVTRILDLSAEDGERLKKAAGVLSPEELIYFIGKFSDLQSEMKWATNERILLEVELMKLCAPWTEKDLTALAARLGELERKMEEGVPVAITQAAPTEKPKEKPKPKRRPPALPEDRKEVQEKWALLRNDVNDAVLKAKLAQVEIVFKEDEFLYLICAYPALTDMIQRGMDKIAAVLEKETGKSFELRTTTKDEYEKWREAAYGKEEETPSAEADAEFASLLGQYFPEADVE